MLENKDFPASPLEKAGYHLTFQDEFDRPQVNDINWFTAYRSGRKEYYKRIGHPSRWVDHNAYWVIEDSCLKLRIAENLPYRPTKSTPCVSCFTTSDHRFGKDSSEFQILDKFAQKHGWFEIRCRMPRGEGIMSAFWLHQHTPTLQEYTPEGEKKGLEAGVLEIDIFEQQGRYITDTQSNIDLNIHFTKGAHSCPSVPVDFSKSFHVFALDWKEGEIDWYVDGQVVYSYRGPTPQDKMFILMALFQYSGWIGNIDPNAVYPKDFEIDYVRVYAQDGEE